MGVIFHPWFWCKHIWWTLQWGLCASHLIKWRSILRSESRKILYWCYIFMTVFSVVCHLFFLKCLFFQLSTHPLFPGRCANALLHLLLCSDRKVRQCHRIVCTVSALACYSVLGIHTASHIAWHTFLYLCWSLWSYRLRRWRASRQIYLGGNCTYFVSPSPVSC